MSTWTHVSAVFRIDGVRSDHAGPTINGRVTPDWDDITGRAIYDGDWCSEDDYEQQKLSESWDHYGRHKDRYMPAGSEGSLQRLVWINPQPYVMARYTVTVFGDLRDYDDHGAIRSWFYSVIDRCHMRQAVCHCVVDGYGEWVWQSSWGSHGEDK